jgi:hypothetical protein
VSDPPTKNGDSAAPKSALRWSTRPPLSEAGAPGAVSAASPPHTNALDVLLRWTEDLDDERAVTLWAGLSAVEDPAAREAALLRWVDWVPARATALAIAVVGDFEDAIYAWRQTAANWTLTEEGAILASASGALGIELGDPRRVTPEFAGEPSGDDTAAAAVRSALGLVWRAIVLGFAALLLLGVGRMVG